MSIAERNSIFKIELIENRRRRECSVEGCHNQASSNHNISRSLLKELADKKHVYELFLQPFPFPDIGLKKTGIEQSTVFRDLCPYHDNLFYQTIDQRDYDVTLYSNIVALNHRTLRNEWFRKSVTQGTHENSLASISKYSLANNMMRQSLINLPFNFRSLTWYMNRVSKALQGEQEFIYRVFEYPYIELAASELFTYEPNPDSKRNFYKGTACFVPFSEIFIHIVPRKKKSCTYVIVSSHKQDEFLFEDYISKYIDLQLGKCLSDILLIQAEKWVCSKAFKSLYVDGNVDFLKVFQLDMPMNAFDRYTNVNLFAKP